MGTVQDRCLCNALQAKAVPIYPAGAGKLAAATSGSQELSLSLARASRLSRESVHDATAHEIGNYLCRAAGLGTAWKVETEEALILHGLASIPRPDSWV
jgi:hypothetical protein